MVLACRTCPDPEALVWSPKRARRSAAKKESSEQAASEQAAADQRLQSRCGSCGGAQQRWKVAGGYVHLCAAWPACGGVTLEAGRGAGPGVPAPAPGRRSVGVDSRGSIFASGNCGWRPGNGPCFWKVFSKCKWHHCGAFFDRQDIDAL